MITWHEVLLRLALALVFCGTVGVERFLAGKAAGVRTHILVGMGAALFTMISGYAFHTTAANADRIAAQVVSGIGFIGGGAILKEGASIRGLTTAAGLWAVAALGMAAGAGLYTMGFLGSAVILVTLVALHRLERRLPRHLRETWVMEVTLGPEATTDTMRSVLALQCRSLALQGLVSSEETRLTFQVELLRDFDIETLASKLYETGARSVSWRLHEGPTTESGA